VQLVLAVLEPASTLEETVTAVLAWANKAERARPAPFPEKSLLLAPEMGWKLQHLYSALVDRRFVDPRFSEWWISCAGQDIQFRLDGCGVELRSEASVGAMTGRPRRTPITYFIIDRPFLLYMKLRQAERPFLATWVDNAELLKPFSAGAAVAAQPTAEDLWQRVQAIAERVESNIGQDPNPVLHVIGLLDSYQSLHDMALQDYKNGFLGQELVETLSGAADLVIKFHRAG
jgi:hypothetical protein